MKFIFNAIFVTILTLTAFSHTEAAGEAFSFSLTPFFQDETHDDPLAVRAVLLAGWDAEEADGEAGLAYFLTYAATPEMAQVLLDAGADINARWARNGNVLFWVRDARMAQFFVDTGAEVNVCNDDGFSPLLCSPDGDVTEVFLKAGAEADSRKLPAHRPPDATPLHLAPDAKAVRLLLAAGVEVDAHAERIPLTPLCCARNAEVTRALLAAGANPCFQAKNGAAPLHGAPDAESVRLLLEAGADVNACTKNGITPLLIAVAEPIKYRHELTREARVSGSTFYSYRAQREWAEYVAARDNKDEIGSKPGDPDQIARVRLLLAAGARTDVTTKNGLTPLMLVRLPEILKLLLDAGASVEGFDPEGKTALHLAETPEKVQLLLAAGAVVDARDLKSRTPLFDAHHPRSVQALLDAGADACAKDINGETPLFYAKSLECVELLLDAMRKSGMDDAAIKAALNTPAKSGRTALTALCKRHYGEELEEPLKILRILVPAGADVNAAGEYGRTPLFYARCAPMVKYLLDAGARVDVRDSAGWTPLHCVVFGNVDAARLLIEAGADVNAETNDGETPLIVLAPSLPGYQRDEPGMTKLLLAAGARVNRKERFVDRMTDTALHKMYNPEATLILIAAGADVNAVEKDGKTPLHTQSDSPEVMQAIIAAGGDIHARDTKGKTPLFYAKKTSVAKILVDAGADVNARDKYDGTPLFRNFRDADKAYLDLMTDAGADFHVRNRIDMTLLHQYIEPWQVRYLVEKGLDVNAKDDGGSTPLHEAHNLEAMKILLEAGADPNIRNQDDETPILSHFEVGEAELTLFLQHGLDVNATDWAGHTLLHDMARSSAAITRMLIAAGADVDARDEDGRTPYFNADSQEIRDVLIEAGANPNVVDYNGKRPGDEEDEEEYDDEDFE